jgi:methylthioribose-1-phosphate isomerase
MQTETIRTVWWSDEDGEAVALLDQSRLPHETVTIRCRAEQEVADAIVTLKVRGAPAIGVTAAFGVALGLRHALPKVHSVVEARAALERICAELRRTRPTAVNLFWAIERMRQRVLATLETPDGLQTAGDVALAEAQAIADEDAAACRAMGRFGAALIADGDVLLTHCNAGALATAGWGTALAPLREAHQQGKRIRVFVDETRPVLQGARLTAWELQREGIPLTLITDNMAAHFMRRGGIRAIFVGADRIAANGDVANKIGTYGLAVLAQAHQIPFYVVAPRSTIDLSLPSGEAIPIEQRNPDEVTHIQGIPIAPEGITAANPAFDVTPHTSISAIITEAGIARAPYDESLPLLFAEPIAGKA